MMKYLKYSVGALVMLSSSSFGAVVYENDFNVQGSVAPGSPLSDNGWGGYVTAADTSVLDISTITPKKTSDGGPNWGGTSKGNAAGTANTYLWLAPKGEGSTDAGVASFLFSTDLGAPVGLAELSSIAVKQSFDGSVADSAKGRFAIKIGTDWYASDYNWESTDETGTAYISELMEGVDFSDGSKWLNLTAATGGVGVGTISVGSAVVGTLSGDITAFGVYIEHGNGGDHIRINDFQVNTVDPVAYYIASTPTDWTDSAAWSDGNPAMANVEYYVTNNVVLNTPATTMTFPGLSLNLIGSQRIDIMAEGSDVITINALELENDVLAAGAAVAGEAQIDGSISVVSNSVLSGATDNSRDLRVLSTVSGSTQVELSAPAKTIFIDNVGNTFSGTWIVADGISEFTSAGAVGSARVEVQSNATLRIVGDWDGLSNEDGLTIVDSATATVDLGTNNWTVSSLTIGGIAISDDTYSVSQLNALGNAVFFGTGTIQVGPPPTPKLLVGWELWTGTVSPATIQTNGITGVATNMDFTTSQYAGSSDGTFGSLPYPVASINSTNNLEGIRIENAISVSCDFAIQNSSDADVKLNAFHFDALTKTKTGGPDTWTLEVVSGDLTVGGVATNDLDYVGATGNLADYDVDLSGLADSTLDAGGSVLFRLTFSGGAIPASGATRLDVDNVGITEQLSSAPTEKPEVNAEISGGEMVISWTDDQFRLQTRQSMTVGDWVDYPGGSTSPVVMPMTNAVEFMRLVYP